MTFLVLPVRRCRRCGEDRPHRDSWHRVLLTCCACGTRRLATR